MIYICSLKNLEKQKVASKHIHRPAISLAMYISGVMVAHSPQVL